ncbi:MAG: DM13 domain-containing protein [Bacteroidia bacterium]|nr:DM13 domain-containing protein [Bacteroidia bacterium]
MKYTLICLLALAGTACQRTAPVAHQMAPDKLMTAATGTFVNKGGQQTHGTYTCLRQGEDLYLELSADFGTDEGPDLHVMLSPTALDSADNDNANVPGAFIVAPLQAQKGSQRYDLPDTLQLQHYRTVMIHCVKYSHLYGAAPL